MSTKPHSEACERNREPILAVLRQHFADRRRVLEIGSGTGQHAVHFAAHMPWLQWQPSDMPENLPGIEAWRDEARLSNLLPSQPLWAEASQNPATAPGGLVTMAGAGESVRLPCADSVLHGFDAVFTANTLHIMGWPQVQALFAGLPAVLAGTDAVLVVYGPFNYGGQFTSASNRQFDGWLKARDPRSGIRDFEAVDALARGIGLQLIEDVPMPANNRALVWRRRSG